VEGLRPDQEALVARHRERSHDALDAFRAGVDVERGLPDPDSLALRELLRSEPDVLVSCAISLLADEHDWFHAAAEAAAASDDPYGDAQRALRAALEDGPEGVEPEPNPMHVVRMALKALRTRRLPFADSDVELMLDLGLERTAFWVVPFTVAAAERLLAGEPGNPAVLAAAERLGGRLDDNAKAFYDADLRTARNRIRALIAANVPGGLLDLSIVDEGDAWAEPALAILGLHAGHWEGVQEVLAHFASVRGSKPTKTWTARMAELLDAHPGAASLSRELLELVLEVDVVSTPDAVPWPPRWLLAPGNETLLKGAAWSLRLTPGDWVVPLLGRLTLRGSARSPDDAVTTPLSAAVASAALDSLIALGSGEARDELRRLLSELRRRDLVKRIAAALDEPGPETASRDAVLRREKQRAVRAKADPRPPQAQRDATRRVRTELAPRLWELGFTTRKGRTFWRHHSDRVEVIHVASHRGELSVEVGVWFRAPRRSHPPPAHNGDLYPDTAHCDLRAYVDADDLAQSAVHAETWFLRWEDRGGVLTFLLSDADEGMFVGGAPGSPGRDLLIGYLAPKAGRPELAGEHLARAAEFFREQLEEHRRHAPRDITPEWESWVEGLEADAAAE
jgi:hypothetical protein